MRYAVLGDIHGNSSALEAVLADCKSEDIDRYLCVGDIVGYGANPVDCIALIREKQVISVCGNHDCAVYGVFQTTYFNPHAAHAITWTRNHLNSSELEFLASLPCVIYEGGIVLVHGSLEAPEQFRYISNGRTARPTLQRLNEHTVCFVGHFHIPCYYWLEGNEVVASDETAVSTTDKARIVANVGSVGQPRDGDPRAAYCIYDERAGTITVKRVAYDIRKTADAILEVGLSGMLASRLFAGM
ncbi:MAG: metallophosphoesterase family protein [Candidatus Omnitrophica bacterium]|nr:metallophosphoesterase family protein [Candidatus Omnitrophota bacterium]